MRGDELKTPIDEKLPQAKRIVLRGYILGFDAAVRPAPIDAAKRRVFLLSPANMTGVRAQLLLRSDGQSSLAQRLRADGAPLGEVFSFISALYFRGKLAYAQAFANPPASLPSVLVITSSRGLLPPETVIRVADLLEMSLGRVEASDENYCGLLQRDARLLADNMEEDTEVVLLGSIATPKYVNPLTEIFGNQLVFPIAFAGRGDMSRGGLLLRSSRDRLPLEYRPVTTAIRSGPRPAKLLPLHDGPIRRKRKTKY